MSASIEKITATKTDLQENVALSHSMKVVSFFLSNFTEMTMRQAAMRLTDYLNKFGPDSIKALHLGILCEYKSDVAHDVAGMNEPFFAPRTLDLWGN